MKPLFRLTILFCAVAALPLSVVAGPEPLPSGKEMKEVAPAPLPECNWTGFYLGLHVGGQFGHAETVDLARDDEFDRTYQFNGIGPDPRPWGYDQSGVVAGGQVGYNYQFHWVVLGLEFDGGYMNIEGRGAEPESKLFDAGDTVGRSDSDFYTTFRGRIGFALNKWLIYGTGGGIAVNWETSLRDDCDDFPCGFDRINAHKEELDWGWTAGGGIEYMIGCHWSIKGEYLYYVLDDQDFSGVDVEFANRYRFEAHDQGHIIRGGLNYKF